MHEIEVSFLSLPYTFLHDGVHMMTGIYKNKYNSSDVA